MKVLCAIGIVLWMSNVIYGANTICEWKTINGKYSCVLYNAYTKGSENIGGENHQGSITDASVIRVEIPGPATVEIIRPIMQKFSALEDLIIENGTIALLSTDSGSFSGSSNNLNLKILKISRGSITELPNKAFHLCVNLVHLDLSKNKIVTINSNVDEGLIKLETLILDDNEITSPTTIFTKLTTLKTYSVAGNKLTSLPTSLPSKSTLVKVDLSRNSLTSVPNGYFNGYTLLEEINFDQNAIKSLDNDLFNSLNVKVLNIASNEFSTFEFLRKATKLESLTIALQKPRLQTLNATMLDENKELKFFNASHNDIQSLYSSLFAKNSGKISILDMRGNRIEKIEKDFVKNLSVLNATLFSCNKCISKDFYARPGERDLDVCNSAKSLLSTALVFIAVAVANFL